MPRLMTESEVQIDFKEHIAPLVIAQYGEDDTVALDTAFNDWTDTLCKDESISEELYNNICRED